MSMMDMSRKGFTIVETVVALSVISILSLVVINFFTDTLIQHAIADARATLLSEAHRAIDVVNDDIRLSANADENNRWEDDHAPGAPTDLYSWMSDADTIVLATAAEDTDGNVLFEDAAHYISWKNNNIYFIQDGTLYRRVLAAPVANNKAVTTCPAAFASSSCPADKELLHNVESFTVRYLDGDNNEVSPSNARSVELEVIRLTIQTFYDEVSAEYTTRMVFRND